MMHGLKSNAFLLQVKGVLDTLRLRNIVSQNNLTDLTEGLYVAVDKIEEFTPQYHPKFRSDENKIGYIRSAVADFTPWSVVIIQVVTTSKWPTNQFFSELYEFLQTKRQAALLKGQ